MAESKFMIPAFTLTVNLNDTNKITNFVLSGSTMVQTIYIVLLVTLLAEPGTTGKLRSLYL